jgi:hypothetical protein
MRPAKNPNLNEKVSHKLVPVHSIRLLVVVTDNVRVSRSNRNAIYGPYDVDCSGLCTWDEGYRVALFFTREYLCHELIAHEVFHATHRILQRQGVVFTPDNSEPFALLNGWLSAHVYREIGRMGEKIAAGYPKRKYLPGEPKLTSPHLDE